MSSCLPNIYGLCISPSSAENFCSGQWLMRRLTAVKTAENKRLLGDRPWMGYLHQFLHHSSCVTDVKMYEPGSREDRWKMRLLHMTWMLYTSTHSSCGYLHKINPVKNPTQTSERLSRPCTSRGTIGGRWLLGERVHFSLWGGLWYIAHAPVDDPTPMCIWATTNRIQCVIIKKINKWSCEGDVLGD